MDIFKYKRPLLFFAYVISLILLFFPLPGSQIDVIKTFLNSDTVFHYVFTLDFTNFFSNVSEYKLPRSFLLFPEYLFFIITRAFSDNVLFINIITSILTFIYAQTTFLLFARRYFGRLKNITEIIILVFISVNLVLPLPGFGYFYIWSLAPHSHVGTFANALYAYLIYDTIKRRTKYKILFLFGVFILTFSDRLFLLYFTIPFLMSQLAKGIKAVKARPMTLACLKDIQPFIWLLLIIYFSIFGFIAYSSLSISELDANLPAEVRYSYLLTFITYYRYAGYSSYIEILNIALWIIIFALLVTVKNTLYITRTSSFMVFISMSMLAGLFLSVLLGFDLHDLRFSVIQSLAVILYSFLYWEIPTKINNFGKILIVLVLSLLCVRLANISIPDIHLTSKETLQCIEENIVIFKNTTNYSPFWDSKELTALSKGRIRSNTIFIIDNKLITTNLIGMNMAPDISNSSNPLMVYRNKDFEDFDNFKLTSLAECGEYKIAKLANKD